MAQLHAHLLINTASRHGSTNRRTILNALKSHNIIVDQLHDVRTDGPLQAICAKVIDAPTDLLIIAGGDGTVSRALHYLADSAIITGIIPLGTTNNFARSLGIPLQIEAAVATIVKSKPRAVDLGVLNGHRFANVAGIGLSARIAGSVSNVTKKRFGRLAYAITGAMQLVAQKPFRATLSDKDGELVVNLETRQIIIANGRFHAGRQIASDAQVNNRELVIFTLGGRSRLSFAWHMLDFYLGKRKQVAHSSYTLGKDIRLITHTPQPIEIDGEVIGNTPINVHVKPSTIQVRY